MRIAKDDDPWRNLRTTKHYTNVNDIYQEYIDIYNSHPESDKLTLNMVKGVLSGMTDTETAELFKHLNKDDDISNITWKSYLLVDDRNIYIRQAPNDFDIVPFLVAEGSTGGVQFQFLYRDLLHVDVQPLLGNLSCDYQSIKLYLLPAPEFLNSSFGDRKLTLI